MAGETLFTIDVSSVQAVSLAICTYYFGVWVRKRVYLFERFAVPSPVIGGMTFAFLLSGLKANGILTVNFDSSLQTLLMLHEVVLCHYQYMFFHYHLPVQMNQLIKRSS